MLHVTRIYPVSPAPVSLPRTEGPPLNFLEKTVRTLPHQLTDPWSLLSFGLGMTAFRLGRLGAMGIFSKMNWAWGARSVSALLGVAAESVTMTTTHRVSQHYSSNRPADLWAGFGHEVLATGLNMGLLRGMGWITAGQSVILQHGATYAGILLGDWVGQQRGWSPKKSADAMFTDALVSMAYFHMNGILAQQLFGSRFMKLQQGLDQWAEKLAPKLLPEDFLVRSWVAMSASEGGGGSKKDNVILFPKPLTARPEPTPVAQGETRDLLLSRAQLLTEKGEKNLDSIRACLDEMLEYSEIYGRHRRLDRLTDKSIEILVKRLKSAQEKLKDHLVEAADLIIPLEQLTLMSRQLPFGDAARFSEVYQKSRILLRARKELEKKVNGLVRFLPRQEAREIFQQRKSLFQLVSRALPRSPDFSDEFLPSENLISINYQGVKGMLFGIGAKETCRAPMAAISMLDPASSRREDWQKVTDMLNQFVIDGPYDRGIRNILFVTVEQLKNSFPILRFHFNREIPLEGWFGLTLPTLVARYGANYPQIRAQSLALEQDLPESYRGWSDLTLWMLTQAVKGKGTPSTWFENLPESIKVMPEIAKWTDDILSLSKEKEFYLQDMKNTFSDLGESAVVPYSLTIFLRNYEKPTEALTLAQRVPVNLREEVLTLTGALLGAYHGPAFFSRSLLKDFYSRWEIPQQKILDYPHKDLTKHLSQLEQFWVQQPGVRKIKALDRPGRVLQPMAPHGNFSSRLQLRFLDIKGDLYSFFGSSASLFRRAQATGVTPAAWIHEAKKLERIRETVQAFHDQLVVFMQESQGVPEIRDSPSRLAADLLNQMSGAIPQLAQLKVLMRRPPTRDGEIRIKEIKSENFLTLATGLCDHFDIPLKLGKGGGQKRFIPAEEIQNIYEMSQISGDIAGPIFDQASKWKEQSPKEQIKTLVQHFSGRPLHSVSFNEILETYYKQIDWRPYQLDPRRQIQGNLSFEILSSILTPAYLEIFRSEPHRAYRDLEKIDITGDPQKLEAWRGFTYLTLRLLQGANSDVFLARDLRETFYKPGDQKGWSVSPLGSKMDELVHSFDPTEPKVSHLLKKWHESLQPVESVATVYLDILLPEGHPDHPNLSPAQLRLKAMLLEAEGLGSRPEKTKR